MTNAYVSVFLCLSLCVWMLNDVVPKNSTVQFLFLVVLFVATLALFQRDLKLDAFRRDGQSVAGAPVTIFALYSVDVVSLSRFSVFARIVCTNKSAFLLYDFLQRQSMITNLIDRQECCPTEQEVGTGVSC